MTVSVQPRVRGACYRWSMSEVRPTEAASDLDAIAVPEDPKTDSMPPDGGATP